MKKKIIGFVILTAMLCTMIAGVAAAAGTDLNGNLITAVEVRGNKATPTEEIMAVIKSKVGTKIDNEQLKADMQTVFDLGYFFNVQIAFESHLSGVKLIFDVVENPKVAQLEVKGTSVVPAAKLMELMETKAGLMLNTQILNKDLRAIEDYYEKQGLILAYIDDVAVNDAGVLTITVNEGFLNDIKIVGNAKTKEYVIRRELRVQPGDVFNLNKVQADLRNIFNLGYFNDVKPRIERAEDGSNKVNLVIEVEEKKTGNMQVGGGYSSKDGWLAYAEIKEQNLLGRGQKVGFKWEIGQSTNYELNFYDPWAFGKQFSFGVDLYNNTNKNGKDTDGNKYVKNAKGASIQIGKPLAQDIDGSIKFKYENTTTNWEKPEITDETGDTRSLTLAAVRNTTDNPFSPHTGGRDTASIEYAGQLLGGTYDFTKYNLEMTRYFPGFKESHTWAFRMKTGFGTGNLPFHETFKIGGGETLRGYAPFSISGNKMLLLNAEYRFPLVKSLEGAAFIDSGNAWGADSKVNLNEMNFAIGVGVRMDTPLGQIRLDYGIGEKGGMPHFSIGQTF